MAETAVRDKWKSVLGRCGSGVKMDLFDVDGAHPRGWVRHGGYLIYEALNVPSRHRPFQRYLILC